MGGAKVHVDALRRRLRVLDQNELRWVDLHKEQGKELTLYIPPSVALNATVQEAEPTTGHE